MSSCFVLVPCVIDIVPKFRYNIYACVRYGYNSLNSCCFCNEKLLQSCCAARDTHFSAFITLGLSMLVIVRYGCFLVTSHFVLAPCVRFGYNSLKSCWFCDEKLMLSFCAARDTHFSAFNCVFVILNSLITIQHFLSRSLHFSSVLFDYGDRRVFLKLVSGMS